MAQKVESLRPSRAPLGVSSGNILMLNRQGKYNRSGRKINKDLRPFQMEWNKDHMVLLSYRLYERLKQKSWWVVDSVLQVTMLPSSLEPWARVFRLVGERRAHYSNVTFAHDKRGTKKNYCVKLVI